VNLSAVAIKRPVATLMFYAAALMLGVFSLFRLPVDLMPNAGAGTLTIYIGIRGGLPPEDIENLVTKVVEEAVSSTAHLRGMISESRKDRAVVSLSFEPGTDVAFASLEVQERLAKIRNKLPKDIEKPVVARYDENDHPIMILALTSEKFTPEQLRDMVDNILKPDLMRLGGVANVEVGGGRERKILVEFNQRRLDAYGINILRVINTIGENNLNLLSGRVEQKRDSVYVRIKGQHQTIEDIKNVSIAVTKEGSRIKLGDVADVRDFYLEAQSYARLNKKPTVAVYVQKESQANTIRTCSRVEAAVAKFQETLDPAINMQTVSNQAVFIREAITNVISAIAQGALLTALILWFFIKDLKHTVIILVSIPLSVILTFGLMLLSGIGVNIMTLSGIALGIGMLVDNSIVVLENIVEKKLHFFRHRPDALVLDKKFSDDLVIGASQEMALPIMASTLCTVIVFIPILFINKQVQILYSGLALTVTYSLVASFFVAVTVVPLLASWIPMRPKKEGDITDVHVALGRLKARVAPRLPLRVKGWLAKGGGWAAGAWAFLKHPEARVAPDMPVTKWARVRRWSLLALGRTLAPVLRDPSGAFRRGTAWSIRYRYRMLFYVFVGTLGALFIFDRFLEKDFMGSTEQNEFVIFIELPSGAKLDISDQVVADVEKVLSDTPEIKEVVKTAAARVEGWSSKIYVTLVPQGERGRSVQEIIDEIRPKVADVGAVYDSFIYFSEPSSAKELIIDVFGFDYEKLREMAVEIANRLQDVSGLADVKLRYKPGQPEIRISIDKERAGLFGFTVKEIAEILHAQIRGLRATYFITDSQQIETVARSQEKDRKTINDIESINLIDDQGENVPLKQVAIFSNSLTPSEIWRKDKQRMIQVSGNRERLALSTAAQRALNKLKDMPVPPDYYFQVGGDFDQMIQNEKEFKFAFLIMIGLVYIVLACLFESYGQPMLIMVTVPLALISVMPVLWATRTTVTMGVYLGMIMLGGLVVTNAIILLDRLNARDPNTTPLRAAMTVGRSRLKAIILVQLTTIVDLMPMIWDSSASSSLWSPLAIAVVGGISGATFLTLFVIPGCYMMLLDAQNSKGGWRSGFNREALWREVEALSPVHLKKRGAEGGQ